MGACPVVRGGVEVSEQLGPVGVAAAGFAEPLIAATPVEGELADQMMCVEDHQVVPGGEDQQGAPGQFPADLVYSPTLEKVLRLVTCGGTFDAGTGHYRDNIIVTAVAAS